MSATAADGTEVAIAPAGCTDAVLALLDAAALPTTDLRSGLPVWFATAERDGRVIGAVGLELYGASGLLRSLAVVPEAAGQGLGRRLVAYAEAHARDCGVHALYLLTTTAAAFFERLGYTPVRREQAPAAIRVSREFSVLCPASATFMSRTLSTASSSRAAP